MCILLLILCVSAGCRGKTPSTKLSDRLQLPSPTAVTTVPRVERLSVVDQGEKYVLTPQALIPIAFNRQPDIKSSYQRFKSEEARYDFFYTSHDSLTPKLGISNEFDELESKSESDVPGGSGVEVERDRDHTARLSVEKRFFDTTQLDLGLGYHLTDENQGYGEQSFASANLRYPLWASRERLERTSEEIFRRSELNDTQLAFIQTVRAQLRDALWYYSTAIFNRKLREATASWGEHLEDLLRQLDQAKGHDAAADRRRIQAEITSTRSKESGFATFVKVNTARLKSACGLPFHAQVELVDVPFDPFEGMSHEELLQLGIETDPEIATLRNAMNNSQVQLDLARRGKWDVALLLGGRTNLEGRGTHRDTSDWSVSIGMEVSAVDARVTSSLIRQAQADIERFGEAISARENVIFVNTFEPQIRNKELAVTMQELIENLPRYKADYQAGLAEYRAGDLNIDDLLQRREDVYAQEEEIARQAYYMGLNVAALCAETGKFFELLNGEEVAESDTPVDAMKPPAGT
ncbi:MAG: TolC family protein [Phycisphaerae bacterium]|nr:TolC family protein [Phycisphaerae bacterium]